MAAERPSRGRIIVFGILFWYPLAGVTYQFLHYLIALRRLGYDPYYIEDSGRWVYDPALNDLSPDATPNIEAVAPVLEAHGFGDRWAFRGRYPGGRCYGMTDAQILEFYREADAFLNVTGAQEIREEHLQCRRRIYVESDPFASQVKVASGDAATIAALEAHDTHFTFGENIGNRIAVPVERFHWLPTRQPVVIDLWHTATAAEARRTRRSRPGTTRARTSSTRATATTGRRTANSRGSSICRGAGRCPSSLPSASTTTSGSGSRTTAGGCGARSTLGKRDRLPRLHPALARRVHRGARPVRAAAHRLVQRSQRLLPGRRPPGDHPGHRLRQVHPDRPRPVRVHDDGRRAGGRRRDRERLRAAIAAQPARSPKRTSAPRRSSAA